MCNPGDACRFEYARGMQVPAGSAFVGQAVGRAQHAVRSTGVPA